jgi:hypothetical protein
MGFGVQSYLLGLRALATPLLAAAARAPVNVPTPAATQSKARKLGRTHKRA